MIQKATDECVCGHMRSTHNINARWTGYCFICLDPSDMNVRKHDFRLDNLSYIEKLAKERKLI